MSTYHSNEREKTLDHFTGVGIRLVRVPGDDANQVVEEEVGGLRGEHGERTQDGVQGAEYLGLGRAGEEGRSAR